MENWYLMNNYKAYESLKDDDRFTSFQKIIIANRGLVDDYSLSTLLESNIESLRSAFDLKDMKKAVDILMESVRNNEKIMIVGDYDQDGVAATVILLKVISSFYDNVEYAIPDRIEDGYGLNKSIVDNALESDVKLIITCDNGIAAFDAITHAKSNNIKVIVTDHHELVKIEDKEKLPEADAIINPHRSDDNSEFKIICGAMVAFKFAMAIQESYGSILGITKDLIIHLSQFAALGTVSDMMPIVNENRIIVEIGLKELNKRNNLGIDILLKELQWEKEINIYTIGFLIGPTINSSGRIYTARLGVELFIDDDENTIREYAKTLVELNTQRKQMTIDSVDLAIKHIEDENLYNNDIIILYENRIHESICGLVAGRIKDKYNKPTIVLTNSDDEEVLKGSGRSIKTYNMFENLNKYRDWFVAFGGHAMACGMSIRADKLNDFIRLINNDSNLTKEDFIKILDLDYNLDFRHISTKLIDDIETLKPYGFGFTEPVFASKNVKVISARILGKNKNVIKLFVESKGVRLEAISFDTEKFLNVINEKYAINSLDNINELVDKYLDIAYKITLNTFNGVSNIQLNLISIR